MPEKRLICAAVTAKTDARPSPTAYLLHVGASVFAESTTTFE